MAGRHGSGFDPNQYQNYTPNIPSPAGGYDPTVTHPVSPGGGSTHGSVQYMAPTSTGGARHGGRFDPNQYQASRSIRDEPSYVEPQRRMSYQSENVLPPPPPVALPGPIHQAAQPSQLPHPVYYDPPGPSYAQGPHSGTSTPAAATPGPPLRGRQSRSSIDDPARYQARVPYVAPASPPAEHLPPNPHYYGHYQQENDGPRAYSIPPESDTSSWNKGKNVVSVQENPTAFALSPIEPLDGSRGLGTDSNENSEKPIDHSKKELAVHLKGARLMFNLRNRFRTKKPNTFQLPGYIYDTTMKFRHRDASGRVSQKTVQDRYLHPMDGKLRKLIVASTDDIYQGPGTSTWRRTYIRNVSPWNVRISTWVMDFDHDPDSWKAWFYMVGRAFVANIALQIAFYIKSYKFFTEETARWHFEGKYAPVPTEFQGNAKVWSNLLENRNETTLVARDTEVYQLLKPRNLCFLRNPSDNTHLHGIDIRSVDEWEEVGGRDASLSYIFIAYFTEHFRHDSVDDMMALSHIAETAARAAGVLAYWVGASNMSDDEELESDVYRISDVLRGAHSMAIAVGRPSHAMHEITTDDLLRQWGTRVWTFPEVLLSPGRRISVYTRGKDLSTPLILAKNQFASKVWTDGLRSRQLVDHYLGTLTLSKLELAVTALRCLYARNTTQYLPGDHAYALMGLLRMRPRIDRNDSPFQAFARLSLANDSDKVLERFLCTLPDSSNSWKPWYEMSDAYESAIWDIEPYCQVAGVCGVSTIQNDADSDTVILDGAFGASIQWKSFYPVKYLTGFSWKRWLSIQIMENNGMLLSIGLFAWAIAKNWDESGASLVQRLIDFPGLGIEKEDIPWWLRHLTGLCRAVAGFSFCFYLWTWLYTPTLIKLEYGGKFRGAQAALFGFEGHLNVATIERSIFGGCFKRMRWSINGSPLSRAYTDEHGDRYGMDPALDPVVRDKIEKAKTASPGQMRIFTLVDTYNMECTLFEATQPPAYLFLCASEGGMQRAIGCSYDWTTQTMYRETVLRMPTTSLNRMDRIPRFKLGVQRPTPQWGVVKNEKEPV